MKQSRGSIKSIIVLTAICLAVTALLAVTNSFTAPKIADARQQKIENSLKEIFPDVYSIREIKPLPERTPSTVKAVYVINNEDYAIVLATTSAYSSGDMGITVGLKGGYGEIIGIKLTSYYESKDFGKDTYPLNYIGKDIGSYKDVDAFAGVTYSSKALKNAIGDAFECFKLVGGGAVE
ncbi:MAG: FMN-binding protein [Clostridia bacterium]|nr:FMN-binding protein [Clostridia bacterium]